MSSYQPWFLHEGVLSLYPAGADGETVTGPAVFCGAVANQLNLALELDPIRIAASGARYARVHHVDEHHRIEVERTWVVRNGETDFRPGRNQQYVLEIVWATSRYWYRRTYYGVTGKAVSLDSKGVLHFLSKQSWEAQRYAEAGGGSTPVYTPVPSTTNDFPVGFFRENVLIVGEYLLGRYRWGRAVRLKRAEVTAFAGQGTATVLELEVNGALTGSTVTLPAGTANTEVTGTADLAVTVEAGAAVRWKVTSGPAPEAAPWVCALMMTAAAV